jgi:cytochrome c553
LHLRLAHWPPELLFRVVRDGIPDSGMPAWPASGRDDEIWSLVAFLTVLPELDGARYRASVARSGVSPDPTIQRCAACHVTRGSDSAAAFPRLDLQKSSYLSAALSAFRDGERASGIMQAAATGLTDDEIERLARHYSGSAQHSVRPEAPPELITMGDAQRKIAACVSCHGLAEPERADIPKLAGQNAAYLTQQLRLFLRQDGPRRGGGPLVSLMEHAVGDLTEQEAAGLASWYAGQPGF